MAYELKFGKLFDKEFKKIDSSVKDQAWKKMERLKENPKEIGKHLKYLNLWELHVKMFRIFYVIDDNEIRVLLLSMKHKDECDRFVRGLSLDEIRKQLDDVS